MKRMVLGKRRSDRVESASGELRFVRYGEDGFPVRRHKFRLEAIEPIEIIKSLSVLSLPCQQESQPKWIVERFDRRAFRKRREPERDVFAVLRGDCTERGVHHRFDGSVWCSGDMRELFGEPAGTFGYR